MGLTIDLARAEQRNRRVDEDRDLCGVCSRLASVSKLPLHQHVLYCEFFGEERSMRAPFQILAIPYRVGCKGSTFAALKRSDDGHWQGVAGGGEVGETPFQAAVRECQEEVGVGSRSRVRSLKSRASIPVEHFTDRGHWPTDMFVIPEYCFGLDCTDKELVLSSEHVDVRWGTYREINALLRWDSNKTALWELNCRVTKE